MFLNHMMDLKFFFHKIVARTVFEEILFLFEERGMQCRVELQRYSD
jgi:hypothetical protein